MTFSDKRNGPFLVFLALRTTINEYRGSSGETRHGTGLITPVDDNSDKSDSAGCHNTGNERRTWSSRLLSSGKDSNNLFKLSADTSKPVAATYDASESGLAEPAKSNCFRFGKRPRTLGRMSNEAEGDFTNMFQINDQTNEAEGDDGGQMMVKSLATVRRQMQEDFQLDILQDDVDALKASMKKRKSGAEEQSKHNNKKMIKSESGQFEI